jgi:iron-sulfur cluster repair protein YtfE (RIC family)
MLVQLGSKSTAATAEESLLGLLTACHARIRQFTQLALALATRPEVPEAEARDALGRCRRYFTEALPLHVCDEEDSLVPRLQGRDATVDAALGRMRDEHVAHVPLLVDFIAALERCAADPKVPDARAELARAASVLADDFETHLVQEETVIFPALERLLSAPEQAAVVGELRSRRSRPA